MTRAEHPLLLIVLDGWGASDQTQYNAISAAATPTWNRLMKETPHTVLECSGTAVGLPDQQMGNSEVGHMHIGSGRLIQQDFTRISAAAASGEMARNPILTKPLHQAAERGRAVHVLGLLSPGGVHSHEAHIIALLDLAAECGVERLYLHPFLDGRDTPPKSAAASLERVEAALAKRGRGRIASLVGRYFAMDRDQRWQRVKPAYELLVNGTAAHRAGSAREGLEAAYARGETDEFVEATVILDETGQPARMEDGDVVVFANFRADRAREITTALTAAQFDGFERERLPALGAYVTMTSYGDQFDLPVAYPPQRLKNTFGAVVADNDLHQLRIAETEKYAHVTFFFNGGTEAPFANEDRELIPSPDVATYDLQPEMSAPELTARLCAAIASERYDAIVCNYANADMVGHTGDFDAAVKCIETIDGCLAQVLEATRAAGMEVLITADHGNAEKMFAPASDGSTGQPHTAHTSNLVPLVYVGRDARLDDGGNLADIAPTMLTLLGLPVPAEMTGRSLVRLGDDADHDKPERGSDNAQDAA